MLILSRLGMVRPESSSNSFVPRFGYAALSRQNSFVSPSAEDTSNKPTDVPNTPNLTTKSIDSLTWSATDQLNHRPSLSQYGNRYERHAKDGFTYWPTDTDYKKPRCKYNRMNNKQKINKSIDRSYFIFIVTNFHFEKRNRMDRFVYA